MLVSLCAEIYTATPDVSAASGSFLLRSSHRGKGGMLHLYSSRNVVKSFPTFILSIYSMLMQTPSVVLSSLRYEVLQVP